MSYVARHPEGLRWLWLGAGVGVGPLRSDDRVVVAGRPERTHWTPLQRARIIAVAGARPDTLDVPATRRSLKRLARYLAEQ